MLIKGWIEIKFFKCMYKYIGGGVIIKLFYSVFF